MKTEVETKLNMGLLSRKIQEPDSPHADRFMVDMLSALNNAEKVCEIIQGSGSLILSKDQISEVDCVQAQDNLRDLGMIASLVQRHGLDIALDEMPRETVFHYGPWHPPARYFRKLIELATESKRRFRLYK